MLLYGATTAQRAGHCILLPEVKEGQGGGRLDVPKSIRLAAQPYLGADNRTWSTATPQGSRPVCSGCGAGQAIWHATLSYGHHFLPFEVLASLCLMVGLVPLSTDVAVRTKKGENGKDCWLITKEKKGSLEFMPESPPVRVNKYCSWPCVKKRERNLCSKEKQWERAKGVLSGTGRFSVVHLLDNWHKSIVVWISSKENPFKPLF